MSRVPSWIKLAAASKDELLSEVMLAIEELGGIAEAQKALRELASEKKSNWVMTERFVTSKTHDEVLMDLVKDTLDNAPMRPTPAPEAPKKEVKEVRDVPKEEAPSPRQDEPEKTTPEKLEGRGAYLYALLAMILGAGALSTINLKNINLQKTIERIKQGDPKVPGAGPALAEEPVSPPPIEDAELRTPSDVKKWKEAQEAHIETWRFHIDEIKDPKEKAAEQEDLEQFERMYEADLKRVEKAMKDEGLSEE